MIRLFRRKKRVCECKADFYDDLYRSGGHLGQYLVHYTESRYHPVWQRGLEIISTRDNPRVLDIGCGPGQFARLLYDNGITSYMGIDCSPAAIELAHKNVPQWQEKFFITDILKMDTLPGDFDFIVLFEVLEHIEFDLNLIRLIPHGTSILFSVPSFESASHVRRFKTSRKVRKRYQPLIDIIELEAFTDCPEPGKTIFLVFGTMKPLNVEHH